MAFKRRLPIAKSAIAAMQGIAAEDPPSQRCSSGASHRTILMLEARQDEQVASKYIGFDGECCVGTRLY
ncbi:hypothetical protein [Scytonema sp. PRP1]|uniref:hypothetical protein n=1 Tax=Scytonema sp. PRP1 TaxID=3120513 RepID=UPI00300D3C74